MKKMKKAKRIIEKNERKKISNNSNLDYLIIYLRPQYYMHIKIGGSVAHTSGVINAFERKKNVELKVISNSKIPLINNEKIIILKPVWIIKKYKPINEIIYNFKIRKKTINLIEKFKKKSIEKEAETKETKKQTETNTKKDTKILLYQRYSKDSFLGAYISKKKKIPLILEFNSSEVWKLKNWTPKKSFIKNIFYKLFLQLYEVPKTKIIEEYNLKNSEVIIIVSKTLEEQIKKYHKKIYPKIKNKILVNPNGVDLEKIQKEMNNKKEVEKIIKKYNFKNNKIYFGFIGTFGPWHGAELLAEAFIKMLKKLKEKNKKLYEKTELIYIGDGERKKEIEKILSKKENKKYIKKIKFLGRQPPEKIPYFYSILNILVTPQVPNPDKTEFFGSPIKLFEYMATKKPIIASNVGQIGRILEHKKTAMVFEGGNINDLTKKMLEIIEDKKLQEKISKNAFELVKEKYTWDAHVERILKKIEEK